MGTETERKFIVDRLPAAEELGDGLRLRQGYLAEDHGVELRVRITDFDAVLTVKAGHGLARTEVQSRISDDDALSLWPFTEGRRIEKVRHRLTIGHHTAEVDVYEGDLARLLVVEVEFDSVETANAFAPPDWFGRELTNQPDWSNASLARHGRPPD